MIASILYRNNSRHLARIINCPSKTFSSFQPKNEDRNCVKKRSEAVVFLLGWTGSNEKSLKKYSEIYDKKGFHVIKYCSSTRLTFGMNPKKNLLLQSRVLLNEMFKNDLQNVPIYFHNLSNGGVCMYYTLLRQFQEKGFMIKVAGTVFDSSPAPYDSAMVYKAAYTIASGNKMTKNAIASVAVRYMMFVRLVNAMRARVKGMKSDIENFRYYVPEQLARCPKGEPQHFIYSQADEVIPARGIEWFIEERRKMGVRVSFTKFKDSSHVEHILKYPIEYRSSLDNFLDFCKEHNAKN